MYLVGSQEMKEIDRITIEDYKVPPGILMENAGVNTVTAMQNELGSLFLRKVYIFCGGGNNGGDGFVIARHLKSTGAMVKVFFAGDKDRLSPETAANFVSAEKYGVETVKLSSAEDLEKFQHDIYTCDVIVDALIGTGLNKDIEGFMAKLIVFLNTMGKYTVAVDTPSGVDCDSGDIRGVAIYADLTVTFGLPKIGLSIYPGMENAGKLVVADISFPPELLSQPRSNVLMTPELVIPMLPYRAPNANKGHFGPILIIGGSPGMSGAVVLAANAALKSGAGIVTAAVPEGLHDAVKARSDEVIVAGLNANEKGFLSEKAYPQIAELAEKSKVIAIGPGIGRDKETQRLVRKVAEKIDRPMVIDADGLNAVSEDKKCLKNIKKDVILTPHIGEMARLSAGKIEDILRDKLASAREFISVYAVNVLLKDGRSILIDRDKNAYVNTTGNSGMATPGSGDVLTGMVSAFMAHGLLSAQAGITANYIHGLAGDLLLEEMSEEGITAGDLVNNIPKAIKKIKK